MDRILHEDGEPDEHHDDCLAASAHINAGDGGYPPALIGLALLLVSFFTQNVARAVPSAVVAEIRGA